MTRFYCFIWMFFAFWGTGAARAQTATAQPASEQSTDAQTTVTQASPQIVQLPSTVISGNPTVDTIHFEWYPAQKLGADGKAPAVVALHSLGGDINVPRGFARYFAQRGVGTLVMELPYHFHRALPGVAPSTRFLSSDAKVASLTWRQAYADVSTVLDWMEARPDVDKNRIGATGISLGAITIHGAMGQDLRIKAGVTFVGAGDFPDMYRHSTFAKVLLRHEYEMTPEDTALVRQIDPISYVSANRPRRVLMIQAARDLVVPPHSARELWNALGRPPIRWVDCGHFGLNLALPQAHRAALSFLQSAWSDAEEHGDDASRLRAPQIYVPTLKAGLLSGLDSNLTPAITLQVASFGTRPDHLAWVHADIGLTGHGPYVGIAAPINQFLDIGYGRRLNGHKFRPYIGAQIPY